MRAVAVTEFGPPDVLSWTSVPDPVPEAGQVLMHVAVADVLWLETMVRAGRGQNYFPNRPPYVSGTGAVGTVVAVGQAVDEAVVGQRVVARTGSQDADAELVVADAAAVVEIPAAVSFTDAAAVMHDGVTALALLDVTDVSAGEAVLVVGASGGLGLISLQLAAARSARTAALARDPAKIERLTALGFAVVNSDAADWPERVVELLGRAPDVVLDNVGGPLGDQAFTLAADGGRFSGHGMPGGHFARVDDAEASRRGIRFSDISNLQLDPEQVRARTKEALVAVEDGTIRPVIGQTFAMSRAADAHRAIEQRTAFGKTLLTPDAE